MVSDNISVARTECRMVGRRGIAGSLLVADNARALAEMGGGLSTIYAVAKLAAQNVVSIRYSIDQCHPPGHIAPGPQAQSADSTDDPLNDFEVKIGIHNEAGTCRFKTTLPKLVKLMLPQVLDPSGSECHFFNITVQEKAMLLISKLGGISVLALGATTIGDQKQLDRDHNLTPVRVIWGLYISALNGLGWSIFLLKLDHTDLGQGKSMLERSDMSTEASGWSNTSFPAMRRPQ